MDRRLQIASGYLETNHPRSYKAQIFKGKMYRQFAAYHLQGKGP
jgi:hypothetical protein